MPAKTPNYKTRIAQTLSCEQDIKLCLLYGSAAAGRLRADSDLDVAVAGERALAPERMMDLRFRLAEATGRDVDLLDLQAVNGTILHQALTRSNIVFVRDHALYASIIQRMLYNQADMMPYVRRMLAVRRQVFLRA